MEKKKYNFPEVKLGQYKGLGHHPPCPAGDGEDAGH